jgi:hypothetical protein
MGAFRLRCDVKDAERSIPKYKSQSHIRVVSGANSLEGMAEAELCADIFDGSLGQKRTRRIGVRIASKESTNTAHVLVAFF